MKRTIWITTSFATLHRWAGATGEVSYLASPHRHTFFVKLWMEVIHDDREIEFIAFKQQVDKAIRLMLEEGGTTLTWSCERWASWLLETFGAARVSVSEDDENGAEVER